MPPFRVLCCCDEAWGMARYLRSFVPGTEVSRPDLGTRDNSARQPDARFIHDEKGRGSTRTCYWYSESLRAVNTQAGRDRIGEESPHKQRTQTDSAFL